MNENVKCSCSEGCEKGALIKTLENNIFSIYGNLTNNSVIVLRYHGLLTENVSYDKPNNITISYFFNDDSENIITIPLAKCSKCIGDCYCTMIELGEHYKISYIFKQGNDIESNNDKHFSLDIKKDPVTDLMQRYGFEENDKLPLVTVSSNHIFSKMANVFNSIYTYIKKFLNHSIDEIN